MEFSIETILTIVTGVAFEPGLNNAKRLVEFMTHAPADELTFLDGMRPQLCKEEIIRQYPVLERFGTMRNINRDNYEDIRDWAAAECGSDHLWIAPVENMPSPEEYLGLI